MSNLIIRLPITVPNAKYKIDPNDIVNVSDIVNYPDVRYYFDFSVGDSVASDGRKLLPTNGNLPLTYRNGGLVLASKAQGGYVIDGLKESLFVDGYTILTSIKIPNGTTVTTGIMLLMNFYGNGSTTANYAAFSWHFSNNILNFYGTINNVEYTLLTVNLPVTSGKFTQDFYATVGQTSNPLTKTITAFLRTNLASDVKKNAVVMTQTPVYSETIMANIGSAFTGSGGNSNGALDYIITESFIDIVPRLDEDVVNLVKEAYLRNFG